MSDGPGGRRRGAEGDLARPGDRRNQRRPTVKGLRREAIGLPVTAVVAFLVYAGGSLTLRRLIPSVVALLIAALICLAAAIRAGQLEPRFHGVGPAEGYLASMLATAKWGSVLTLVFSLLETITSAIPTAGSTGGPKQVHIAYLSLSWSAIVISIAGLVLARHLSRRFRRG